MRHYVGLFKGVLLSLKSSDKSASDSPSTDDKRLMAQADDQRAQISTVDEHYTMHEHTRRGSRSSAKPKTSKSGSASSTNRQEKARRHSSVFLSEEPESIETEPIATEPIPTEPIVRFLREQIEEKDRDCEKLRSAIQELKSDLLKHITDPYAKHRCSDGEIQRHYERLLHRIDQTARRLCDLRGNNPEALVDAIDITTAQEDIREGTQISKQLEEAKKLLRSRYRAKFLQKSVAEMILFRALLRFALPPEILSTSLTQEENEAGRVLMKAMRQRAKPPDENMTGWDTEKRLLQIEKWRIDTVIYVTDHPSASGHIETNQDEMRQELNEIFKDTGDGSWVLKEFIDIGFDFAQLLQKQKSTYYFENLEGELDVDRMDFQDPRQAEYLQNSDEDEPERVLVCIYPAFLKRSSSEIVIAKGKALYSGWAGMMMM